MGMFVDPSSCPCEGCRDFLAGNTGVEEPPGLCNLSPPSALNLQRQTAAPADSSPIFSPVSTSSSIGPTESMPWILPQRTNGGGIQPPALGPLASLAEELERRSNLPALGPSASGPVFGWGSVAPSLGPTPTGLGNWRALHQGFRQSRWEEEPVGRPLCREGPPEEEDEEQEQEQEQHGGLCECDHENTGMSQDLKEEIFEHLTQYLTMLEKHQKVMSAKMDLYAFLLEDASVRLRLDTFNKKIKALKETLEKME